MKFNRLMVYLNLTNQETRRLSNNLAQATKVMIKKNWKIIYIKAVPAGDKDAVRFYYKDNRGQVYNGQVIRNTGLSKGKYMAGSLRQIEALQELVHHCNRMVKKYHPLLIS